jgi:hypothetical protein
MEVGLMMRVGVFVVVERGRRTVLALERCGG